MSDGLLLAILEDLGDIDTAQVPPGQESDDSVGGENDDDDEDEVINFNALDRYKADQMAHHHAAEAEDEGEEPKTEINLDEQAIAEDLIDSAVEDELDSLD